MPTISQLPVATAVSGADQLPISQNGLTRSLTVATLLNGTQSTISLAQGSLLGRTSTGLGGPEPVGVGIGLSLQGTSVAATGQDHLSFAATTSLLSGDEVILNSSLVPKRLPATALRSIFTAGSGVAIDPNGVISATASVASGGAGTPGSVGATGPQGPAGQGFNFRGGWLPNTSYLPYDVLVDSGQSYVVTTAFTSAPTFDASHLTLIAAEGSAGAAGPQGPAGVQGPAGAQGPAGPIVPATAATVGAVKPGGGLTVSSDGTLSIANVNLSSLAQTGAATGQLLGWTGTGWGPTTASSSGVSTFNTRSGAISLTLGDVTAVTGTGAGARASFGLATVAATGAFSDLNGTPAIPAASTAAPTMSGVATAGVSNNFARADHIHPSDTSRLVVANNLSDVANASTARTNLGLGTAATLNVGTTAGTVAAGNDPRIATALQPAAIPVAIGQLLAGSASAGTASAVAIGTGLSLSAGTLSVTSSGTSSYVLPPATTATLGGVKPDGTSIIAAADGTLTATAGGVSTFNTRSGSVSLTLGDVTAVVGTGAGARATLGLAAVAATGAFSDLSGAPQVPAASTTAPAVNGTASAGVAASFARADHVHPTDPSRLAAANNLSDVGNSATARNNLGLGAAAMLGVGTASGTVAAGNDSRIVGALQAAAIPAASGQLLGGTSTAGTATAIGLGTGLSLSGGLLSATGGGSAGYILPAATTATLGGVKPDGSTLRAASDGTLSATGVATFNLRSGVVSLTAGDVTAVLGTGATARTSLGLATVAASGAFSDLTGTPAIPSPSTTAPTVNGTVSVGVAANFARGDHVHPTDASRLAAANNLSDVANAATARTNLGLGTAATLSVGNTAGTVAAGNDSRIAGALQTAAIPAASGQLLGGSGSAGAAAAVIIGTGLTLSGGTLSASGGGGGGGGGTYSLPAATTSSLGGVKPDGVTLTTATDGTLTVTGVAVTALTDISTLGGPALSDIDLVNRNNTDYRTTLSARTTLFRKTPAGSRTVTLASGATTATLTATDHDKTVVVNGTAGTLTVDGTITDGFRCQVINHTASALAFSGITGLGATSLATTSVCWVSLSNATVEATLTGPSSGTSSYTLPAATTTTLGGVKPDGSTITAAADGTLTVPSMTTTSLTDISTLGGPVLTDIDVLNRSGNDYKATLAERATLYRKTPAGSRTATLASGATTATLTALDHDKTVVVNGIAGTLTVDNTITDGFRCQVINHTGSALTFTGIAGLQGTSSVPDSASCVVTSANAAIEATPPGATTAYISVGVAGIVGSLPGGPGAVVYRYVFVRPCTLAANLATPYGPQGQAGTLPTAAATFGIAKRQSGGTQTTVGSITMSTSGTVTASAATAASFAPGDELIVTAPSPADSTLADISLTFTGTWG